MGTLMAIEELERGRDFANKLRRVMFKEEDDDDNKVKALTENLVAKVLDSFTNTLSLFNHQTNSSIITSSFSHFPANSDESHEDSPKTKRPSTTIKDRIGSPPKKRKIAQIQTWVEESKMSPKEDGYSWRKYGQKNILNDNHPRNYYRCTHKHEQGCKAIKHVQKIKDDPPLYKTTYYGYHTCANHLLNSHFFIDSHEDDLLINSNSCFILSFQNNNNNNHNPIISTFDQKLNNLLAQQNHKNNNLFISSGPVKKEEHCDDDNNNNNFNVVASSCSSNNNECFVSHPPHHEEAVLPTANFGYGDYDAVDVFNSASFYDPLIGGFEDLLFGSI